jgi:hypothetical protein
VASLLPLHNFCSTLIRLLYTSSSEAGEIWVRNMAAEFCLQSSSYKINNDLKSELFENNYFTVNSVEGDIQLLFVFT